MAAPFDQAGLSALLEREVHFFQTCESTQTEALALAQSGAPGGTLVVSNAQVAGKGRQGRSWHTQAGQNLMFSLLLRPPIPPDRAPLLCLATGVALAQVLDLKLKWPNDLLDEQGRKVGGILAELEAGQGFVQWAIIGVGINVNQVEFPPEIPNPSSLAMQRGPQDRAEILRDSVFAIERWCAEISSGGESMLEAWRRRSAHLGQRVRVGEIEGIARDLREDGALLVETSAGLVPILAGDVEMVG